MSMKIMMKLSVLFLLLVAVQAQNDQSGFISIDCGLPANTSYVDPGTGIYYVSDAGFIDSGESKIVSPDYQTRFVERPLWTVRSFPEGTRNCYTLRPPQGRGNRYLIRATFFNGGYDGSEMGEKYKFELHLGSELWETIESTMATNFWREIIHTLSSDSVSVCLVRTGASVPFISVLELRLFNNSMYPSQSGSLKVVQRRNFNPLDSPSAWVRYKDDVYDREWFADTFDSDSLTLSTTSTINNSRNSFQVPSLVMSSARLAKPGKWLNYSWEAESEFSLYYIYLHFAELQQLESNQSRKFNIYINSDLWIGPYSPSYLLAETVYSLGYTSGYSTFNLGLFPTKDSTLPPTINAAEIFVVKKFSVPETFSADVEAISSIKSAYGLSKNWQGDPCSPEAFTWDGVNCTYDAVLRIIFLNLSSIGLEGAIAPAFSNLSMLQILDLSHNSLTGEVPSSLAGLSSLKVLNLKGNKFTGTIPAGLLEKSESGKLSLSFDETNNNNDTNHSDDPSNNSTENKKNNLVIPIVASVAAVLLVILALLVTLWICKRRTKSSASNNNGKIHNQYLPAGKRNDNSEDTKAAMDRKDFIVQPKNRQFTYDELVAITDDFQRVIGEGGFGRVFHGYVGEAQVAVKVLSQSSQQGYKEFQAEANLLMTIHHKHLTGLVGYCYEGSNMGIIYEYMKNGTLEKHLFGGEHVLTWPERLHMAMDAAQGLEYLHHGCKPSIVHRDIKTTNILLDENFQAKLADFGLSRAFPTEGGTHINTVVAGTFGYLDPESYSTGRITEKSDVYSFGVVLLEMVTGRPAIPRSRDEPHIVSWVSSELEAGGDLENIVDQRLQGDYAANSTWKFLELAMACVARNSSKRPAMTTVTSELQQCLAEEMTTRPQTAPDSSNTRVVSIMSMESAAR